MSIAVAVCASAGGKLDASGMKRARVLGGLLAKKGVVLLNGACGGYSYEAICGAREAGGVGIGISPFDSKAEQESEGSLDLSVYSQVVYTGFGFKGRNVIMVRTCDAAVFVGGGTGTLNEFTIAYDEGKVIGVLDGVAGTTELIEQILEKNYKKKQGVIREFEPSLLAKKFLKEVGV